MKGKAYPGIDAFRIVAAILVIAIHTYPLADLNSTADYLVAHVVSVSYTHLRAHET